VIDSPTETPAGPSSAPSLALLALAILAPFVALAMISLPFWAVSLVR
jgi:hypothetical protein